MKTKTIREMDLTEFGDFEKSKTIITETCSICLGKDKRIAELEESLTCIYSTSKQIENNRDYLLKQNSKLKEALKIIADSEHSFDEFDYCAYAEKTLAKYEKERGE